MVAKNWFDEFPDARLPFQAADFGDDVGQVPNGIHAAAIADRRVICCLPNAAANRCSQQPDFVGRQNGRNDREPVVRDRFLVSVWLWH
jgi:hypothetical protein